MRKVFLYRDFEVEMLQEEISAAQKAGFVTVTDRNFLMGGDVVLPRFYPFYNYLSDEFAGKSVSFVSVDHEWVADIRNWLPVLGGLTPQTWDSFDEVVRSGFGGPFFVKGIDKSMKYDFHKFCFAPDLDSLPVVLNNLRDVLPVEQPLVIREFVPLTTYGVSSDSGMPIAHEFRVFVYDGHVLSDGFYWENFRKSHNLSFVQAPSYDSFLQQVISVVGDKCKYYALDIALTAEGEWIVIELNDGCLSGLSANNPYALYNNLYNLL